MGIIEKITLPFSLGMIAIVVIVLVVLGIEVSQVGSPIDLP
jgi:hypothetical protein